MKNRRLRVALLFGIFSFILLIALILFNRKEVVLDNTVDYNNAINKIAQYVDELDQTNTSASFTLQTMDNKTLDLIEGNQYKIFSNNNNITITLFDPVTNDPITYTNNIFTLPANGVLVKVSGITRGNKYNIKIQPVTVGTGYKAIYKEVNIELDYTDILNAYIQEIIDNDNNQIELDDNDRAVFVFANENDIIRLRSNNDIEIEYYYSLNQLTNEELNNVSFIEYDKNNYLKVSTNGYLYARARYKTSKYSNISMLHINNIDKLSPVITNINKEENDNHFSASVSFHIDDQTATNEYGKSGIDKYILTSHETLLEDDEWTTANAGDFVETVFDNGTYYLHVMDKAGNISIQEIEVSEITFFQENGLVLILSCPSKEELVGKTYDTLQGMMDDFAANNLTNNDRVIAQIEADFYNQYIDIENINLTIDLNGYQIESKDNSPVFTIKDGATLKIVDNKYELSDYIHNSDQVTCVESGEVNTFNSTGDEQTYTSNSEGYYKLEVWGAAGGFGSTDQHGGYGGYSTGIIKLINNQTLYVNVGGQGSAGNPDGYGGYNGGGYSGSYGGSGGGGGATHIATVSGLLETLENNKSSVIIVAGAGGGWANYGCGTVTGGHGGGFKGNPSDLGGTQTQGGPAGGQTGGAFGKAGYHSDLNHSTPGAGSGWYGGGTGSNLCSGGGGSGYIGNTNLTEKAMYCYDCEESSDESTLTISTTGNNQNLNTDNCSQGVSDNAVSKCAKNGDGAARITKLSCSNGIDIDYSLYTHGENYGSIKNINYDAIHINNGGILQLGEDNSPDIAHIEYPDHNAPYIFGKNVGVTNNGTFNYYDGLISGTVGLDGEAQDTPHLYYPSVVMSDDNLYHLMTLDTLADVEALIGKTRYSLLEEAINAANNKKGTPDDQIEIDIVNDITKTQTVVFSDQKNIKLDLNGHNITNSSTNNLFENYGKLEVIDSVGGATIQSNGTRLIVNHEYAYLTIAAGTWDCTKYSSYTVLNDTGGHLTINNGIFKKTSGGYTIYNNGGFLTINDGTFTGYKDRDSSEPNNASIIYNADSVSSTIKDPAEDYPLLGSQATPYVTNGFKLDNNELIPDGDDYNKEFSSNIPIDLSNDTFNRYEVELELEVNVRENIDYVSAHVASGLASYRYNTPSARIAYLTGNAGVVKCSASLRGGYVNYVYIGYLNAKNNSEYPEGGNVVKLKSIKIIKYHEYKGIVDINGGSFSGANVNFYNLSKHSESNLNNGTFENYITSRSGIVNINGGNYNYINNNYGNTFNITGGTVDTIYNQD